MNGHKESKPPHLNRLPDISQVTPYSTNDEALFAELKAVLEKHNAVTRFGVTLLHQHFDLARDEVLCETTDVASRQQEIRPIPKKSLSSEPFVETSWRLDTNTPTIVCVCKAINGHGHYHVP